MSNAFPAATLGFGLGILFVFFGGIIVSKLADLRRERRSKTIREQNEADNRHWHITKQIPDTLKRLEKEVASVSATAKALSEIPAGETPEENSVNVDQLAGAIQDIAVTLQALGQQNQIMMENTANVARTLAFIVSHFKLDQQQ